MKRFVISSFSKGLAVVVGLQREWLQSSWPRMGTTQWCSAIAPTSPVLLCSAWTLTWQEHRWEYASSTYLYIHWNFSCTTTPVQGGLDVSYGYTCQCKPPLDATLGSRKDKTCPSFTIKESTTSKYQVAISAFVQW